MFILLKWFQFFLTKLKQKISEIDLTEGNQKRDFKFINDVVSVILIVLSKVIEFD